MFLKFNDQAKQIKPTLYERNNETVRARQSNTEPASKSPHPQDEEMPDVVVDS